MAEFDANFATDLQCVLYTWPRTGSTSLILISNMFEFLGLDSKVPDKGLEKIRWTIDPQNTKQNDNQTYQKVPNIDTINSELSSRGYGALF